MTERNNEIDLPVEVPLPTVLFHALLSLLMRVLIGFSYAAGALLAARIAGVV